MQQTLNFLNVLDKKTRLRDHNSKHLLSLKDKMQTKRISRYPYAKAIDFNEAKYSDYPRWLTQKEGFADFMYKNYENKLMSIPKICEKMARASDEKYFVSMYLQQIPIFSNLPGVVIQIILTHIKTKYFKVGDVLHYEHEDPQFLGIVYVGAVQYKCGKRTVVKEKNDVIMTSAFHNRRHETIICKEESIILALDKSVYHLITTKLREDIETKERDEISDLMKSIFFNELHIKDKKARNFYNDLQLEFYFKDQTIEEAGAQVNKFYILFRGDVVEENHIYVREHNKWPLPNRKWEVRAVYNSYHKNNTLPQFSFFGDEELVSNTKFKSKYVSSSWVVLFSMTKQNFLKNLTSQDLKRLKKFRAENIDINYTEFEDTIREKVKSHTERRKIVLKAINTSLAHKSQFSPRRMTLINSFEKSMLRKTFFSEQTAPL